MVDGHDGIPVSVAAQRLRVSRQTIRLLAKAGVLVKIPLNKAVGSWERYHIEEKSLKNYTKKRHWAEK